MSEPTQGDMKKAGALLSVIMDAFVETEARDAIAQALADEREANQRLAPPSPLNVEMPRDLSPTPEIAYLRGFYDAWERCRPVENGVQHGPVGPGI